MSIIEQIKTEVERRIRSIENCPFIEAEFGAQEKRDGKLIAYKDLLSFLSTLESEKQVNQEGLEEEIHKYNKERFDEYFPEQDGDFISEVDFMTCLGRVARHFAQWGAERLADARKTSPKDLEEAAKKYVSTLCDRVDEGLKIDTTLESAFKAGAKWDREQMLKGAVIWLKERVLTIFIFQCFREIWRTRNDTLRPLPHDPGYRHPTEFRRNFHPQGRQ